MWRKERGCVPITQCSQKQKAARSGWLASSEMVLNSLAKPRVPGSVGSGYLALVDNPLKKNPGNGVYQALGVFRFSCPSWVHPSPNWRGLSAPSPTWPFCVLLTLPGPSSPQLCCSRGPLPAKQSSPHSCLGDLQGTHGGLCELEFGTCSLPLHGLNHELPQLPTCSTP